MVGRLPDEQWKRIDGEPMHGWYEVSSHGRVRHVFKTKPPKMLKPVHKIDPKFGSDYWYVHILGHERKIAKLVWEAFVGELPKGMGRIKKPENVWLPDGTTFVWED